MADENAAPPRRRKPRRRLSRRQEQRRSILRAALVSAGVLLLQPLAFLPVARRWRSRLRPPGALEESRLLAACIKCGQCVQVCPVEAIRLADLEDGLGVGVPYIDARSQACDFSCDAISCVLACPTGALSHDVTTREEVRCGLARLDRPDACLARQGKGFQGSARGAGFRGLLRYEDVDRWNPIPVRDHAYDRELCDLCVLECPIGEKALVLEAVPDERGIPRMTPTVREGCVGCGVCEMICPQEPTCIVVDERKTWGRRMSFLDDVAVMLGRAPRKPKRLTDAAEIMHGRKRGRGLEVARMLEEIAAAPKVHTWRNRRWAVLISVNLLFSLSFWLDIQVLEGSLTASRFLGFHLADVYSSGLVMLSDRHVAVNLVIGSLTVLLLWGLIGRSFCSWVCIYHVVAEWAESLHVVLAARGIVRDHALHRSIRSVLWVGFAALALATGQALFLTLNPIGILSRALIYGPGLALGWVVLLFAFEVVYAIRAWCRYVCPVGLTYGFLGAAAPLRVRYNLERCAHEGECRKVCEVPHVLEMTIKGRAPDTRVDVGPDCTRCGMCVDACPTRSLEFDVKGLSRLL